VAILEVKRGRSKKRGQAKNITKRGKRGDRQKILQKDSLYDRRG